MILADEADAGSFCERSFCQWNGIYAYFIAMCGIVELFCNENDEFLQELLDKGMVVLIKSKVCDMSFLLV